MPPIIAVLFVLALSCCFGASPVCAQSESGSDLQLEVRAGERPLQACLTSEQLRARVIHYSSRSAAPRGLRLILYLEGADAAELQILRNGEVVSRRRFEQLPSACADRRDAVALSIALALERAAASEQAQASAAKSSSATRQSAAEGGEARRSAAEGGGEARRSAAAAAEGGEVRQSAGEGGEARRSAAEGGGEARRSAAEGGEARRVAAGAVARATEVDRAPARVSSAESGRAGGVAAAPSSGEPAVEANAAAVRDIAGAFEGDAPSDATLAAESQTQAQKGRQAPAAADPEQATRAPASPVSDPDAEAPVILDNLPTTTSHDPRRVRESSLQLHLGGRLALEVVPMTVWVGALGIELPLPSGLSLEITALASTVGEAALAGARARASFLGLEAIGCAATPLSVFMLQICGGASLGLCTVRGDGYPRERPEATLLWAAGVARVMLRWPSSGMIAARVLVQPHLSISRPELRVEESKARLRSGWVGGSAGIELWLALP